MFQGSSLIIVTKFLEILMELNKNINNQCLDNDTNPHCSSDVSNPTSFKRIWIYENKKNYSI